MTPDLCMTYMLMFVSMTLMVTVTLNMFERLVLLVFCFLKMSQRPSIDDILRDPIVARRYEQIEPSAEHHAHSSDSCEGAGSGSGGNVNNNNSKDNRLSAEDGAARLKQMEEDCRKKLRQLELKEKELDSKFRFGLFYDDNAFIIMYIYIDT